jgi:hypothetical protein
MGIVRNTNYLIKKYLSDFENKKLRKPCRCEICGKKCNLTWHADYIRKIITLSGIYHLPIKRLMCPLCKHTFALLPEFVKKFRRYAKDVIAFAVEKLKKFYFEEVRDKLDRLLHNLPGEPEIYLSISTLYQWKKKF